MICVCPSCKTKNSLPTEGNPERFGRPICAKYHKPLFPDQTAHFKSTNEQYTYTWPNGDKYFGQWRDGKKQSQGTQTYANGYEYIGEWEQDKRHGQGNYKFNFGSGSTDEILYKGKFQNDKYHGQGYLKWDNGLATFNYKGGFFRGKKMAQVSSMGLMGKITLGIGKTTNITGRVRSQMPKENSFPVCGKMEYDRPLSNTSKISSQRSKLIFLFVQFVGNGRENWLNFEMENTLMSSF